MILRPDGTPDHEMLLALRTRLTLDDALLLVDLQQVGASWQHANAKNADALRDLERDR